MVEMGSGVDVVLDAGADFSESMVVVGLPTLGIVGTITAQYLVDQLGLASSGGIYSDGFPPVGRVEEGRSGFPVRLHVEETPCGPGGRCENLVVAVAEFLPGPATVYKLAEGLTRWAIEQEARALVIPDGVLVSGEEGETVYGVAAEHAMAGSFQKLGVTPMNSGVLMGFSAAMIANGRRLGLNTLSLLAESAADRPDARAASRLVSVLDAWIPAIDIETAPLVEEAEKIEEEAREIRGQIEQQLEHQREQQPGAYDQMYQ